MPKLLKPQPKMSDIAEEYAATALRLAREVQESTKVDLDLKYGSHDEQGLDLYLPDVASDESVPVLIFIHGGGWSNGYKEWMGFMAPAFTPLPAIFVSIDYRLTPEVKVRDQVDDIRAAVKWVYQNIAQYGGDPNRIFIGGHSAGGHLSAFVTLQRDGWKDLGLPENVIKGCFPVSASFDLSPQPQERLDRMFSSIEDIPKYSPINYVAGNSAPFFISYGENDFERVRVQAEPIAQALRKEGGRVEILEFSRADHFQANMANGDINGEWAKTVRSWMGIGD